jgi:hypothetical protein
VGWTKIDEGIMVIMKIVRLRRRKRCEAFRPKQASEVHQFCSVVGSVSAEKNLANVHKVVYERLTNTDHEPSSELDLEF